MGILMGFTYMAIRLLSGGLSLWKMADESRDLDERGRAALDLIHRDLWLTDGSVNSKFVVDYGDVPTRGESMSACRLRFVRTMNRIDDARMRGGFANRGGSAAVVGDTVAAKNNTKPGGDTAAEPPPNIGLLEVAYSVAGDPAAKDPSLLQLRRAFAPAEPDGGAGSIFTKDYFTKTGKGFNDPASSGEVIAGVLYFGVKLGSQRTTDMDKPRDGGGPENVWDSTRFEFTNMKLSAFTKFTFGSDRPLLDRERIYPRRVRVQLLLAREDADRRNVKLAKEVDFAATDIPLDDPTPLEVSAGDIVKIGGELVEVADVGPRFLKIRTRAALGTKALSHAAGVTVQRGRMYTMDVPIDAARDVDLYDAR